MLKMTFGIYIYYMNNVKNKNIDIMDIKMPG